MGKQEVKVDDPQRTLEVVKEGFEIDEMIPGTVETAESLRIAGMISAVVILTERQGRNSVHGKGPRERSR